MKRKMTACLIVICVCFPVLTVSASVFDWPHISPGDRFEISLNIAASPCPFSTDEMERQLNISAGSLKGITVTRLPAESEGSLYLNGKPVSLYQEIDRESLEKLIFIPADGVVTASLAILPEVQNAVQTQVSLNVQDNKTLFPIEACSGKYETFSEVPLYGYLSASHPNGDFLRVILVEKPEKGTVSFQGQAFCYEPFPDSQGMDRFTIVLADENGNRSSQVTQMIDIEPKDKHYDYWDLNGSPAYYSAVKLLQNGVFTGETIGSRRYFKPQQTVTRGEFLMLLISACGWEKELPSVSHNTGLQNDDNIPSYLKPYVSLGVQKGIILEKEFHAQQVPSHAESVVLVDRTCRQQNTARSSPHWKDANEIPEWALQSYQNLSAYGFLSYSDNRAHPNDELTRENIADLLWQCRKYNTISNIK